MKHQNFVCKIKYIKPFTTILNKVYKFNINRKKSKRKNIIKMLIKPFNIFFLNSLIFKLFLIYFENFKKLTNYIFNYSLYLIVH